MSIRTAIRRVTDFFLAIFGYKTIGARALIVKNNRILLIKQTHAPGWHTVGGNVERGETPVQAVQRELMEEVGLKCVDEPRLFGVYHRLKKGREHYTVLYVVDKFKRVPSVKSPEIAETGWFYFDNLPDDVSGATKRRIAEYRGKTKQSETWF